MQPRQLASVHSHNTQVEAFMTTAYRDTNLMMGNEFSLIFSALSICHRYTHLCPHVLLRTCSHVGHMRIHVHTYTLGRHALCIY